MLRCIGEGQSGRHGEGGADYGESGCNRVLGGRVSEQYGESRRGLVKETKTGEGTGHRMPAAAAPEGSRRSLKTPLERCG